MRTILIVEDNEMNMTLFNDLLQAHGFNTLHSVDGMDIMLLAREHRPDLILMDIKLPKVSGLEHTKTLRADDGLKHIPVLAVTALAMRGDKEKILESGCDGYVTKPIHVPDFLDEVEKFLNLAPFRLTDSLMTGHPEVDSEHEQLVVLLNEVVEFLKVGDDKGCTAKINELTKALKSHFENEERIMEGLGYKHLKAHKKAHRKVIENYDSLIEDTERNGYGSRFINELTSIFVDDFIKADMGFKRYIQDINLRE